MIHSLFDIPAFSPLEEFAAHHRITLSLRGSVASRVLLRATATPPQRLELFDLTPFMSDIDLVHSGLPELTPALRETIELSIPFAPWFRWSVVSRREHSVYEAQMRHNALLPLRLIEIGSDPQRGVQDPYRAVDDAHLGIVRFERRPTFPQSPLGLAGRDFEATGALLLLDAIADLDALGIEVKHDRFHGLQEVAEATLAALDSRPHASYEQAFRRLWYRLAGTALRLGAEFRHQIGRLPGWNPLLDRLAEYPEFRPLLKRESEGSSPQIVAVSSYLGPGRFRLPRYPNAQVLDSTRAQEEFAKILDEISASPSETGAGRVRLGATQRIVGGIMGFILNRGHAGSVGSGWAFGQEFIHLSIRDHSLSATMDSGNLSALFVLRNKGGARLLPGIAVLDWSGKANSIRTLLLRANLGHLYLGPSAPTFDWPESLDVYIVQLESEHD